MTDLFKVTRKKTYAHVTLDRPESRNAIGRPGDGAAARAALGALADDDAVRCVILTGSGSAFSAGGDLKAMAAREGLFEGPPETIARAYERDIQAVIRALYGFPKPIVSAINGPAIGLGLDVALMGDIRIASTTAKFASPFLRIGLAPGDGGAWILPRAVGEARAADLFFTGRTIDAETGRDWGIVSEVLEADALMTRAEALAEEIAGRPAHALRLAKTLLRRARTGSLDEALAAAAQAQGLAHHDPAHMAALQATLADLAKR